MTKTASRTHSLRAAPVGGSSGPVAGGSRPSRKQASRNPWLEDAGVFKDDPTFVAMMKEIYKDRAGDYSED